MTDPTALTMQDAAAAIRTRALSPVDLVRATLDRIAAVDGTIHAYLLVLRDEALAAARVAEEEIMAGHWRGPLHGIPFAVKDNYATAGVRTCANSRLRLEHVPAKDATAITRLKRSGAILMGKLNTWEYGTSMGPVYDDLPYPHARNPWNTDRLTGGSSTGAGAAVAARTAFFALGSDTGGSIRLPAAACGLQGLKATTGRVSRAGVLPNCWAFDVAGPLCWTVADCATILVAIAGHDPDDPVSVDRPIALTPRDVRGLRIGVIADPDCDGVHADPAVLANLQAVAGVLAEAGATLVEAALPAPVVRYRTAASVINWAESFAIHEADFRAAGDRMGQALRDKMMAGLSLRAGDYIAALRERRVLAQATDRLFADLDLLLLPGAFHVAPRADEPDAVAAFTSDTTMTVFSMSGHPALSVMSGFDHEGMPTAVQLVGRWFDENTLLAAAQVVEERTSWRAVLPVIAPAAETAR